MFEVIDLINRDYPRGGIASPGLTAGTCLRKDFAFSEERSNAPGMLLAVSRVNESVPLFLVEGIRRRIGDLAGAQGRGARAGLQARHRRRARLARAQARSACSSASWPTSPSTTPTSRRRRRASTTRSPSADVVVVATNHSDFGGARGACARIDELAADDCLVVDPWNAFGSAQVFAYATEVTALTA